MERCRRYPTITAQSLEQELEKRCGATEDACCPLLYWYLRDRHSCCCDGLVLLVPWPRDEPSYQHNGMLNKGRVEILLVNS